MAVLWLLIFHSETNNIFFCPFRKSVKKNIKHSFSYKSCASFLLLKRSVTRIIDASHTDWPYLGIKVNIKFKRSRLKKHISACMIVVLVVTTYRLTIKIS